MSFIETLVDFVCDFLIPFGGTIVVLAGLLFGGITAGTWFVGKWDCEDFAVATGYETRWGWAGCFAKQGNDWVPYKYIYGNSAHELRIREKK